MAKDDNKLNKKEPNLFDRRIALLSMAASFLAVIASVTAALWAYWAEEAAQSFTKKQFLSETSIALLDKVSAKIPEGPDQPISNKACHFIGSLAKHEVDLHRLDYEDEAQRRKLLVYGYVINAAEESFLHGNCLVILIENNYINKVSPDEQLQATSNTRQQAIGKYHAVIASYKPTSQGCDYAKKDVNNFKKFLKSVLSNHNASLYIARTTESDHYAVTVDTGDDLEKAKKIRDNIKKVSSKAGGTGADSFVQVNKDWFIDNNCFIQAPNPS